MFRDSSEKSLIEILQDRPDTCFYGHRIDESEVERMSDGQFAEVYQDGCGNYYQTRNDYIQTREENGCRVAVFVADENAKNIGVSHPYPDLPHLIGLYVREPYRSEGIASELIHEFMQTAGHDQCVVDCSDRVKPFYEQLDCEVIYLEQFKR